VITNKLLDEVIGEQLPCVARDHILSEPAARNTASACALAVFLLEKRSPDTVIGIFPADHVVKNGSRFGQVIRAAVALAASGPKIAVLGVSPTRAETAYVTATSSREALWTRRWLGWTSRGVKDCGCGG
jgi:mannose-1-phosphate guanylyltransferase